MKSRFLAALGMTREVAFSSSCWASSLLLCTVVFLIACKPAQSGANSSKTPAVQKKWEFALGDRGDGSLALSDDGNIIAACKDGFVYAVDSNGALQWKTYIGATSASPALGQDGAIYIANDNGSVFALNRSGSQRWKSIVYSGNTFGHNAAAVGRTFLYTPSRDGLKALNLSDGRVEWSTVLGSEQWTGVTLLSDGTILFGGHARLNAVNAQGDSLWQYPPLTDETIRRNGNFPPPGNFPVVSGITPGPDHVLLMGMAHDELAAIGQDGSLRWKFDSRGTTLNNASPVVAADGTIYFAHSNGHLYAFDSFGTKKWDLDLTGAIAATPVLTSDGTIFATAGRTLYAVSPAGKILAQVDVGTEIISSPTIAPDGTLYILNLDGTLTAYAGGHGPLMDSPWPKFQADLSNSGNQRQ